MPIIVGISGVSGSGKTSLVKELAHHFQATSILWDDFDSISISPADYVDWYKRGQDYAEWNYEALAHVLNTLKGGQALLHPTLKTILSPTKYIFYDAPLGYKHQQTGQYIDVCVHIHVPLDISLCRRIIRDFQSKNVSKDELLAEMEYYLNHSRPLFFDEDLKKGADLIVDGMLSIKSLREEIIHYLEVVNHE